LIVSLSALPTKFVHAAPPQPVARIRFGLDPPRIIAFGWLVM
jgi:hypothetical protein